MVCRMNAIGFIWQGETVLVTDYLGKDQDGRDIVLVKGSISVLVGDLKFINSDDPYNPFTSVWFDPQGRMHFAE